MAVKIVCYGDSNTYGYDPRSYLGGRYPESVRWTGLLKATGWEIQNEGENGRSIPRLDEEIRAAAQTVRRAEARGMTVMLGSNDLLQRPGLRAETLGQRMEQFLTALLDSVSPGFKVLLIAPPPMRPGAWVSDKQLIRESCRIAGCYQEAADTLGIGFADAAAWDPELSFDGVHFSEAGHRSFALGAETALERLFQA